jgi:hypothetical protein
MTAKRFLFIACFVSFVCAGQIVDSVWVTHGARVDSSFSYWGKQLPKPATGFLRYQGGSWLMWDSLYIASVDSARVAQQAHQANNADSLNHHASTYFGTPYDSAVVSGISDTSRRYDNRYLGLHGKADSATIADSSKKYDNRYLGLHGKADSAKISDTTKCKPPLARRADTATYIDTIPGTHVVSGNGTQYYVPRFATDGKTLVNSLVQQNSAGTAVGIGGAPDATYGLFGLTGGTGSWPMYMVSDNAGRAFKLYAKTSWPTGYGLSMLVCEGTTTINQIGSYSNANAGTATNFMFLSTQTGFSSSQIIPYWQLTAIQNLSAGGNAKYGGALTLGRYLSTQTNTRATCLFHYYDGVSTDELVIGIDNTGTSDPMTLTCAKLRINNSGNLTLPGYSTNGVLKVTGGTGLIGASTNMDSGAVTVGAIPVAATNTHTLTASNAYDTNKVFSITLDTLKVPCIKVDSVQFTGGTYIRKDGKFTGDAATSDSTFKIPNIYTAHGTWTQDSLRVNNGISCGQTVWGARLAAGSGGVFSLGAIVHDHFATNCNLDFGTFNSNPSIRAMQDDGTTPIPLVLYSSAVNLPLMSSYAGQLMMMDGSYNLIGSSGQTVSTGNMTANNLYVHTTGGGANPAYIRLGWATAYTDLYVADDAVNDFYIKQYNGASSKDMLQIKKDQSAVIIPNGTFNITGLATVNTGVVYAKATTGELGATNIAAGTIAMGSATTGLTASALTQSGTAVTASGAFTADSLNVHGSVLNKAGKLTINNGTQAGYSIQLTGKEYYQGNTSVYGMAEVLGVNRRNNRQIWFFDDSLPSNSTDAMFRIASSTGITIGALSTDGTTALPMQINSNTGFGRAGTRRVDAPGALIDSASIGILTFPTVQTAAAAGNVTPTSSRIKITGAAGTYTLLAGSMPVGTMIWIYENNGTANCIVQGYLRAITLNPFTGVWAIKDESNNWCLAMPAL